MSSAALLLAGIAAVLASSSLFTNGLEWLGSRLRLSHGALGSVFAALGTALPEASIAVLAAVLPDRQAGLGQAVSIGAVLGAPLLLGTLGFAVLGLGALRAREPELRVGWRSVRRDLVFFLGTFGAACLLGVIGAPLALRLATAVLLALAYAAFVVATLTAVVPTGRTERPHPLLLTRIVGGRANPAAVVIALQLAAALGLMLLGAELFVHTLTGIASSVGLSGFFLAALIAPLATELPETVNSLVWIARGKDALASGNVTGALVLQGAVIPALGMMFTPWHFDFVEGVAAAVALGGATLVLVALSVEHRLRPWVLLLAGTLYVGFVLWAL